MKRVGFNYVVFVVVYTDYKKRRGCEIFDFAGIIKVIDLTFFYYTRSCQAGLGGVLFLFFNGMELMEQ